ncbi:hypothetical protein ES702_07404 [subsurface metagenome]
MGRGNKRIVNRKEFYTNRQVVSIAGTAEQLASLVVPTGFEATIMADPDNVGYIRLGNAKANAESHSASYLLPPGKSVTLAITNFNLAWIDADVNGEGILKIVEIDV